MAFRPKNANQTSSSSKQFDTPLNFPTPKAGSRPARVSLIVDLGVQEREDFDDGKGNTRPQKPCQQVAVFADLVRDVVDYGGGIGKAPYRLLLNKQFAGKLQGINFVATPPKDVNGNLIPNKPWALHPASLLTKLAKSTGNDDVITDMDISKLLNGTFTADVKITEKESDKKDDEGNPIVYKFVNFAGAAKVPPVFDDETGEEKPAVLPALQTEALCIGFDDAKPEHVKFLRGSIIQTIKLATNYAGSQIQKAIEAFEADPEAYGGFANPEPKEAPAAKAPKAENKPAPKQSEIEDDESLPY